MGKADVNVNIWLSEKNRFANLFNGVIYGGENVILPEDLEEVNPVSSVNVKNRVGKTKSMKKYRDIIMRWKNPGHWQRIRIVRFLKEAVWMWRKKCLRRQ